MHMPFSTYVDDLSGKELEPSLVQQARRDEVQIFKDHDAYFSVHISECHNFTGKQPIRTRWLDVNKGDEAQPEYRSRCVPKETNRGQGDDIFAGTPPIDAKTILFSLAMTDVGGQRAANARGRKKLLFIDVRRAYFHAPAQRPIYVHLPDEFGCPPGHCAKLNISMYGTRDAASNWEMKYPQHLRDQGFRQGLSSPLCVLPRGPRRAARGTW